MWAHGRARSLTTPATTPALLRDGDTRNVVDAYRYWTREAIIADIDARRHPLHIAIENFGNDANIGAVVRTANAFAVDTVHIVGPAPLEPARGDGDRSLPTAVPPRHHRRTAGIRRRREADRRRRRQRAGRRAPRGDQPATGVPVDLRPGGTGHHRRAPGRVPPSRCRSPSSARPAASTPASPPASRCTPGSLNMGTFRRPGRAGSRPWISYGPIAPPAPRPRSPSGI